jgi:ribonuclease BN (tRNA processing enzyme)
MRARIAFAGVGGAFASSTLWNNQAVLKLEDDNGNVANILLDCSPDARHSLKNVGIGPESVHAVAVTHFHGDHVFGLEWLGFHRRFMSKTTELPTIICPGSVQYDLSVYRRLKHILQEMLILETEDVTLEHYFNFNHVDSIDLMHREATGYTHEPGFSQLEFNGVKVGVCCYRVPHVRRIDHHKSSNSAGTSLAYMFSFGGKKILFTGDIQFCPDLLMPYYKAADMIVHDCADYETESRVHARLSDLLTLPDEIQRKTILSHHSGACIYGERGLFRAAEVGAHFEVQL